MVVKVKLVLWKITMEVPNPQFIYKIIDKDVWAKAEQAKVFTGVGVDVKDGFIHFSTAALAPGTALRFFKGTAGLLLVAVNVAPIADKIKWEKSGSGGVYPHLYEPLSLEYVAWAKPLPLNDDGSHDFTGLL